MDEKKTGPAAEATYVFLGVIGGALPVKEREEGTSFDPPPTPPGSAILGHVTLRFWPPGGESLGSFAPPGNATLGFAPPGPGPVGFAPPGDTALGIAAPGDGSIGFAPPGDATLGFAAPGDVLIGIVGNGGVITHVHRVQRPPPPPDSGTGDGSKIVVWQDDPANSFQMEVDVPDANRRPTLDFSANGAHAPRLYSAGSPPFRYWVAVDALCRAAAFWDSIVHNLQWQSGQPGIPLAVLLDEGEDFNAYYDRRTLNFFHGRTSFGTVYSGESPDILYHELGHAVLDAIKPELFDAASSEAAAFHEAFADISSILNLLQIGEFRSGILMETRGHLYSSSRLSRLAEQLGAAIRLQNPQAVDADCLRNAVNSFVYADPQDLPHSAPASQLSSEPHSLSRVFTGAFFQCLADVLEFRSARIPASAQSGPDWAALSDTLLALSRDFATSLVEAVKAASVVSNFLSQVAAEFVAVVGTTKPDEAAAVRDVFIRRALLSMESAIRATGLRASMRQQSGDAAMLRLPEAGLGEIAIDAQNYRVAKPLHLLTPGQSRPYEVRASAADATPIEPASAVTAARSFLDDAFRRGRVHVHEGSGEPPRPGVGRRFHTHVVMAHETIAEAAQLKRVCFDCGIQWR
jgi:hypothetical protein